MADFSFDIKSLTANDQVTIQIGTTAGGNDVADQDFNTVADGQGFSFTPPAATLFLDIQGYDTTSDAHTIDIDNVSITDGGERITNGNFSSGDLTGWTEVVATVAVTGGFRARFTGFGGPGAPTILRQSFASSFTAVTTGAGGGCRHHHCADGVIYGNELDRARYERMMADFERQADEEDEKPTKPRRIARYRPKPPNALDQARQQLQRESNREVNRRIRQRLQDDDTDTTRRYVGPRGSYRT
jgi:hypothetical protein